MRTQMETFGLSNPHFCDSRRFFRRMKHPGANNCACPKMDDGLSCVPSEVQGAWFAYIGLTGNTPTLEEKSNG